MLVNTISGIDFKKKVKFRIYGSILFIFLGIISLAIGIINSSDMATIGFITEEHAVEFTNGFYFGLGGGLMGAGLATLVQNIRLLKNKEKFQVEETKYNDERNRFITSKLWSITGMVMLVIIYILLVVSGLFNIIVYLTLLSILGVFGLTLLIVKIILNKIY